MIGRLCDSNVWIALAIPAHVHHNAAREWFDGIDEAGAVHFCRATQQSMLRLLTSAAVLHPYGREPLTNAEAWDVYDAIAADDRVIPMSPEPPDVEGLWRAYAHRPTASPKLWMDAYLAALALGAEWQLVTTDTGFTQFQGLDVLVLGADAGADVSG
jgi:toxin-antitoxin system PIN domain toxin